MTTEVEIIQKITSKKTELERKKAESAGADVITALEKEIEELTASLPRPTKTRGQKAFLDECAG